MSLIVDCNFCGERISLRKMPHGKHVPFDAHTNDPHKCTKSKSKKVVKKESKNKKTTEFAQTKEIPQVEENYIEEEDNFITANGNPKDIFKDDTLDSLKNEIEVETTNKKNNKFLIYAAAAAIIILIIYLNN
jgi:hypothetical protein